MLHWLQILRIQLSSEDDLFLLHTLEVSEEDFQALKAEQGILVDFSKFPDKIISLLERCMASHASQPPRCICSWQTFSESSLLLLHWHAVWVAASCRMCMHVSAVAAHTGTSR